MLTVSAVITAAGKNSRMRKDQEERNIPLQNKLTLPLKSKEYSNTIIETTIHNVLNTENIHECIVVLGHYSEEILPFINNIHDDRLKIVKNDPIDVGLSLSLLNGLQNISSDIALCVTGDQPTVSTKTFNSIINTILNSNNPKKTISVLRRIKIGKLDTAKGLGMPFAADRKELIKYLKDKDDNLNPILREIFADGFDFYGVEENHPNELININHYSEYESIL
ncbi:molybdenum cofactor cytidylyltransferase [Methanobrevibacter olleyae]|uniref:Molybdenum cofactor cytidylyltransferase n=1 Tax=Methanobrevibacter olleyae TaxID=294671 RepID=A0A1I4GJJ8_METOL|nr:NTP transferase domain-containing protein [Methanobrevibacter olleyae]SFL29683.1 molybdenum cofactor cytidylyltransferase [Methanobrevibacter olleyae]